MKDLETLFQQVEENEPDYHISIFIDELHQSLPDNQNIIEKLSVLLDHLWISPANKIQMRCAQDDEYKNCLEHLKSGSGFEVLNLNVNFRNNKEISQLSIEHVSKNERYTPSKLALPPINCPSGREPSPVGSLADGIEKAQEKAERGVLVIIGDINDDSSSDFHDHFDRITDAQKSTMKFLDQPSDEPWAIRRKPKLLKIGILEIRDEEALDFLQERNNVLFVSFNSVNGFEWPTVVYYGNVIYDTNPSINSFCRCTTSLFYTTFRGNLQLDNHKK